MLYHGTSPQQCVQISSSGALLSVERQTGVRMDRYRSTHVFLTPHPETAYTWATHRSSDGVILGFRRSGSIMVPDAVPLDTLEQVITVGSADTAETIQRLFAAYHPAFTRVDFRYELQRIVRLGSIRP